MDEGRHAPKLRRTQKFCRRSEPVQGFHKLSLKKKPKSGKGKLAPVLVQTPEMWEKVVDLRKKMLPVEESTEENSMDLDAEHKETADSAGNR